MKKVFWIIVSFIAFVSCDKEGKYDYPLVITGQITNITSTSATFHGDIKDISQQGITEYGFCWGLSEDIDTANSNYIFEQNTSQSTFSAKIDFDLYADSIIYVKAFAANEQYTTYGRAESFKARGSQPPKIDYINSHSGYCLESIIIEGDNFSNSLKNNTVNLGGVSFLITYASKEKIICKLPAKYSPVYNAKLSIEVAGQKVYDTKIFTFNTRWIKKANLTEANNGDVYSFSINDLGYVLKGNSLYAYNYVTDSWIRKASFTGIPRKYATYFVINDKFYIGLGYNSEFNIFHEYTKTYYRDFYEYDPDKDLWSKKTTYPGASRRNTLGFTFNNRAYIIGGYLENGLADDMWEYIPDNDSWEFRFFDNFISPDIAFSNNTTTYVIDYNEKMYKFNPETNETIPIDKSPFNASYGLSYFNNDYCYISSSNGLWQFNTTTGNWSQLESIRNDEGVGFFLNNNFYNGIASSNNSFWMYHEN